ncbi:MAG: hypothetical protein AB7P76_03505 [Candidatus Melainabacteria bacterium]
MKKVFAYPSLSDARYTAATAAPPPARSSVPRPSVAPDTVDLRFPFRAEDVVVAGIPISDAEKREHLAKIAGIYAHARKSLAVPFYTGRHFASRLELNNGLHAISTNIETNMEEGPCDVETAFGAVFNQMVDRQAFDRRDVKAVYTINAHPDKVKPIPCQVCLGFMNSDPFQAETRWYGFFVNTDTGKPTLMVKTLGEMLPLHKGRAAPQFTTEQPLSELPVTVSETAQRAMDREGVSEATMRRLLGVARRSFEHADLAERSKKPTGSAVLFSPMPVMLPGGRVDYIRRRPISSEEGPVAFGLNLLTAMQQWLHDKLARLQLSHPWLENPIQVKALAYYGEDADLPSVKPMGLISRHRGSPDTLVVTCEDDAIQIRTVSDYLPFRYETGVKAY